MPETLNPETALRSINGLARQGAEMPDLPETLKALLAKIEALSRYVGGDTSEPSDLPKTENQSL